MANKKKKRCLMSLVIVEMYIKPHHSAPTTRTVMIKKNNFPEFVEMWRNLNPIHCWSNVKWHSLSIKQCDHLLKNLHIYICKFLSKWSHCLMERLCHFTFDQQCMGFKFLHISTNSGKLFFLIITVLVVGAEWWGLMYISTMTNDIKHLFFFLLAILFFC